MIDKRYNKVLVKKLVELCHEDELPVLITMNDPHDPMQTIKIYDGTPCNVPLNELEWTKEEIEELEFFGMKKQKQDDTEEQEDNFPDDLDLEEQPKVNIELITLRTILDNLHEVKTLEDTSGLIDQFEGIWDESHVGVLIALRHWEKIMTFTKEVFPDKTQEELVSDCDFVRNFLLKIREINGKVIEEELKELIGESPINMNRMLDYLKLY